MAIEGVSLAFADPMLEPDPAWTRLDSTPNLVASYEIRRGRQDEFEKTGTGTATVALNDTEGDFDPLKLGGLHGAQLDGRQAAIALRNPVTDTWSPIFRGFTDAYTYELERSGAVTRVEIECCDALDYLAGVEIAPGANGDPVPEDVEVAEGEVYYLGEEVDDRIHALLTEAQWPAELRTIFSGNVVVQQQIASAGTSILQLLADAADAEFSGVANVYVSREGKVTFHGRHARFDPETVADGAGAAWTFTRWKAADGSKASDDPTYAQLRGLSFSRQRKQIINAALAYPFRWQGELTGAEMAAQVVTDPGSIAQYGVHSWSAENLMTYSHKTNGNDDLAETRAQATYYVQNYAQPQNRITQLVFRSIHPSDPRAPATWALLCGVEISDTVRVHTQHAGGGGFIDEEFYVEGISYDVRPAAPGVPDVTLSLDVTPQGFYQTDPFEGDT